MLNYFLVFVLFAVGLYGVIAKSNIVKKILGLAIFTYAVNILWVLAGYKTGGSAPIISPSDLTADPSSCAATTVLFVDPLPQAIVLTAIVIDLAVMALAVSIALRIYEKFGTFDINEIKNLKG